MRLATIIKATYKGVILLILLAFISGVIFSISEGRTLGTSLYWALITMTTVGYGDVPPESAIGKVVSVVLACFGVLLYGYLVAIIMTVVMDVSFSDVMGMNKCRYKNHFVLCGWTPISEVVLVELLTAKHDVAVITETQDDLPNIRRWEEKGKVFAIYGDPSKSEILKQTNVMNARVIVLCTDDDSKNLITTQNVKELNPNARIIVKTSRAELKKTLKVAGVTYVVTPHEMAGRLIASAAFEPEVANFVEDVTTATMAGCDLQQYIISSDHSGTAGKLAKIFREKTRTTLVGVAKSKLDKETGERKWAVYPNPDLDMKVRGGDIVILLGNEEQFKKVRNYLGTQQGR